MTQATSKPDRTTIARRILSALRDARWMNGDRARAYCRVLLAVTLAGAALWVLLSQGGLDRNGKPLGSDFISFWTASKLALAGHASDVYRPEMHGAAQLALMPQMKAGYFAFFYPPIFLLICLPLALLPYFVSLGVWLGATLAAYWRVARGFLGREIGVLPVFAFPAVLLNIAHGQNGFLSMALLGGGSLALQRRPIIAGLLFGALCFKPHLGLMIPIALISARRWKTFFVAAATVAGLAALSYLVFGPATWHAFIEASGLARTTLENGLVDAAKMQSSFAGVRLLGGTVALAYVMQALVALAAAGALVFLQRARPDAEAVGPALAAATLLASPFLLDYDLTILAIPLAWLAGEGVRKGFLPWEKLAILLGFALPLVSRAIALEIGVPVAPFVIALVMVAVLRRGLNASAIQSDRQPEAHAPARHLSPSAS